MEYSLSDDDIGPSPSITPITSPQDSTLALASRMQRKLGGVSVTSSMRIVVYGKDARTDAIVDACTNSGHKPDVFVCTEFRNPGFLRKAKDVHHEAGCLINCEAMVNYARKVGPTFAIVGPEEPLAVGLVDALERIGIPSFGPRLGQTKLEASKSWAREFLERHCGALNPRYRVFRDTGGLKEFLKDLGEFVVKPDGLTGGKGVRVSGEHLQSIDEGLAYATEVLRTHPCVVIEERLEGEEFSLQTISDGERFVHCPLVQDHKRAFEGDLGPNTGGMGSYSCPDFSLPFLGSGDLEHAKAVNALALERIAAETQNPYRGVLYGNYIATGQGLKLIEFNARFGDPEAMNVLPLLETDFVDMCLAAVQGRLSQVPVKFRPAATVCKYVVPHGYPMYAEPGGEIEVPEEFQRELNLRAYFAAVNVIDDRIIMTGSRAVAYLGIGPTLEDAERLAEKGASSVTGPVRHRRDIGTSDLIERRIRHMRAVREHLVEVSL